MFGRRRRDAAAAARLNELWGWSRSRGIPVLRVLDVYQRAQRGSKADVEVVGSRCAGRCLVLVVSGRARLTRRRRR